MTIARKIHCPSCQVVLKIPATISAGKRIRCPKCTQVFSVPDSADATSPARPEPIAAPRQKREKAKEPRKERPAGEKRPKKKAARKQTLTLAFVAGGAVLLLGGGVVLALVRPWEARKVMASSTPPGGSLKPRNEPRSPGGDPERDPEKPEANPKDKGTAAEASLPTSDAKGETDSVRLAAGRKVYESLDCSRCHALGGSAGGQKRGRGPDLSHVGADATHTADWLSQQIRNPRSHRPGSRMPGYEGKINPEDLRKMSEYLASLK